MDGWHWRLFSILRQYIHFKINEKGEFQPEEFMDLMKMASDNETMIAMCDEVSQKCANVKDDDM